MSDHQQPPSASVGSQDYWWYLARGPLLERALGEHLPRDGDILDVGSADGPSARWVKDRPGSRVASFDLDPSGLADGGVCGSVMDLPFRDGSFDAVCAFDVIEHCAPEADALAEVHRVLRPGGVFLMAVPAYRWAWSDHDVASGHHRRYTMGSARTALARAGFAIDRTTHGFAAVFPLFAAQRLALRLRAGRRRGDSESEVEVLPRTSRPVHHALMALCRIDEVLLARGVDLPFGSSVFVAAHRRD